MIALLFAFSLQFFASANTETVIAFVGDSLTEGLGVEKEEAYPALIGQKLSSEGKKVRVINAGISGATSAGAVTRVRWVLKANPDWIVLALGANDGLRGLDTLQMKKNLLAAIDEAEKSKVKVLLAGMKVPPNFGAQYGKKFEQVFLDIAKERKNILYLPFLLDRVGGEKDMNISDGIHPNAKGHEVMAEMILKVLRPKL